MSFTQVMVLLGFLFFSGCVLVWGFMLWFAGDLFAAFAELTANSRQTTTQEHPSLQGLYMARFIFRILSVFAFLYGAVATILIFILAMQHGLPGAGN